MVSQSDCDMRISRKFTLGGLSVVGTLAAVREVLRSPPGYISNLVVSYLEILTPIMSEVTVIGCSTRALPNPPFDFHPDGTLQPGVSSCWISTRHSCYNGAGFEYVMYSLGSKPRIVSKIALRIPSDGPLSVRKFYLETAPPPSCECGGKPTATAASCECGGKAVVVKRTIPSPGRLGRSSVPIASLKADDEVLSNEAAVRDGLAFRDHCRRVRARGVLWDRKRVLARPSERMKARAWAWGKLWDDNMAGDDSRECKGDDTTDYKRENVSPRGADKEEDVSPRGAEKEEDVSPRADEQREDVGLREDVNPRADEQREVVSSREDDKRDDAKFVSVPRSPPKHLQVSRGASDPSDSSADHVIQIPPECLSWRRASPDYEMLRGPTMTHPLEEFLV
ncbi:hypothetical protein AAMO2058_001124800 [Amorphochlora amoebiformis]